METHIRKWGNSLGIRIPSQVAQQLHFHQGSPVTLEIENGKLVVQTPHYDLETMLANITSKNKPKLLLDNTQLGNEEW